MPSKWVGLFTFMLFVLAIMVFWNFLIRSYVGRHAGDPKADGLAFVA